MKRFILVLTILILSSSMVMAFPFSFDFETPEVLRSTQSLDRIKAFQSNDDSWYVVYLDTDNKVYIEEFSDSFVSQGRYTNSEGLCFDGSLCEDYDATYYESLGEEYIRVIALEDDNKPRMTITDFKISDKSLTQVFQGGDGVSNWNMDSPMIDISSNIHGVLFDDEILLGWERSFTSTEFVYTNDNLINVDGSGDGTIDFYSPYDNPDDSQIAFCNQHYYIGTLNDTSDDLFIHGFELDALGELDFLGTANYGLTSAGTLSDIQVDDWSLYAETTESDTDILHMILIDRVEKLIYFYAWECEDNGRLNNIHTIQNEFSDLLEETFDYDAYDIALKYDFEDLASPISDSSGNNNTGVYNGNLLQQFGVFGRSIGFDGGDDYVSVNDSASLDINDTDFTIIAWVNIQDVIPGSRQYILDKNNGTHGYEFYIQQNSPVNYALSSITNVKGEVDFLNYDFGSWEQLGVRYNGTHIELIHNGAVFGSPTIYSSPVLENDIPLSIGSNHENTTWSFDGGDRLDQVVIFQDYLNDTEINDLYLQYAGTDTFSKPFLTKDSSGLFRAFYQFRDPETSVYSINTIGNFGECACNDWIAQDVCEYDSQKFIRDCSPVGCESNTTYWTITDYCSQQYNETQGIRPQGYEWESGDSSCVSEWVDVGQEARCYPDPIQIPVNCVNISAYSISVPEFDGDGEDDGNFTIQACTPSVDCEINELSCEQVLNYTYNWIQDVEESFYQAGDTITGMSTLRADLSCKDRGLFDFSGISRYRVFGELGYACQIACENEWLCIDPFNSGYRQVDCEITNTTACEYGCEDGECVGFGEAEDHPTNINTWLDWILKPNTTTKFAYSLFGSVIIGFIVMSVGKNSDGSKIGSLFAWGFGVGFAFFILIGWIDWVVLLIIVFFVGGYALLNALK